MRWVHRFPVGSKRERAEMRGMGFGPSGSGLEGWASTRSDTAAGAVLPSVALQAGQLVPRAGAAVAGAFVRGHCRQCLRLGSRTFAPEARRSPRRRGHTRSGACRRTRRNPEPDHERALAAWRPPSAVRAVARFPKVGCATPGDSLPDAYLLSRLGATRKRVETGDYPSG